MIPWPGSVPINADRFRKKKEKRMKKILVLGVAGGTGSGKSTLTEWLKSRFGDDLTVIRHDDYYKEQHALTYEQRVTVNYDCPEAFDTDLLVEHLTALKAGREVDCPVYDYTVHDRSDAVRHLVPTPVVVLDGILILENPALCSLMDVKIFVDTDDDIRILRRIERDVLERDRSLTSIINQYRNTVKPMHEKYVQPSRRNADIVILGGGMNPVANGMIETLIKNHIAQYRAE